MGWRNTIVLGILAGGFISMGTIFSNNLLPVTIGNIIGGTGMVGLVYWFIYLRKGLVPRSA
jgi:formate/nitrite transporter FocA (FNT family)